MIPKIPLAAVLTSIVLAFTVVVAQPAHPAEPHHHPEAQMLRNPAPADTASVAAGKQLYVRHCRGCHGPTGQGDGGMALGTKPPSLVEPTLRHGSSDGEIFAIIRSGGVNMDGFGEAIPEQQVWHLVNYIKSLRPSGDR